MNEEKQHQTSQILNTSITSPVGLEDETGLRDYFSATRKFGPYATLTLALSSRERIKIVVGQDHEWLGNYMNLYFKEAKQKLTINEISGFIDFLRNEKKLGRSIDNMISQAPHKKIEGSKLHLFYLEDIYNNMTYSTLIDGVIGQILIERFTKRESRLVPVLINNGKAVKKHWVILVQSKKNKNEFQILDPSGVYSQLGKTSISSLDESFLIEGTYYNFEVLTTDLEIEAPKEVWNSKTSEFSLINTFGKEMNFKVLGRSPAERKFREEDKLINSDGHPDDELPVEVGYHPFWFRLGHTTIRIGEALYELTSKGWKRHYSNGDKARAFIFNNPYFKTQLSRFGSKGIPALSIGCAFSIKRSQLTQLRGHLDELCDAKGSEREKFSLLTNNCNHGVMKVLEEAGVPGFTKRGYYGFSTILSFRKLMLRPQVKIQGLYIYPLPGTEITPYFLRRSIPAFVYKYYSFSMELMRVWCYSYFQIAYYRLRSMILNKKNKMKSKKGNSEDKVMASFSTFDW